MTVRSAAIAADTVAINAAETIDIARVRNIAVFLQEIRHCFFSANQVKNANCVSASAEAQHIEELIKRKQYPS
ncbi:MAG: hypothetical protein ACYS18_12425 [Planctomycetota bacterium]|jgi:Holliday junction resolvasome RuvABC endonuclease subunit